MASRPSMKLMMRMIPRHFRQVGGINLVDLLNEPGPVFPVFLRTLIRLEDAGDPVVFGFFSLSQGDITVVSIIPHHLLSPVRDVGTHGGQPLKGIEDLFSVRQRQLSDLVRIDDLVKSQKSRHSRGGGSPEMLDLTGFPLSRE